MLKAMLSTRLLRRSIGETVGGQPRRRRKRPRAGAGRSALTFACLFSASTLSVPSILPPALAFGRGGGGGGGGGGDELRASSCWVRPAQQQQQQHCRRASACSISPEQRLLLVRGPSPLFARSSPATGGGSATASVTDAPPPPTESAKASRRKSPAPATEAINNNPPPPQQRRRRTNRATSTAAPSLPPHPSTSGPWRRMYGHLYDYYRRTGHCRVPRTYGDNPKLGRWVALMRQEYRASDGGGGKKMTAERYEALNRLGFTWDLGEFVWRERFDELVAYRAQHGDYDVPVTTTAATTSSNRSSKKLAVWVRNQRAQYRHRLNGRYSTLTDARLARLSEIGFDLGVRAKTRTTLQERYAELRAYRSRHGDCNVPQRWADNAKLGGWLDAQRFLYRNRRLGREPGLTDERVAELEEIGIEWDVRGYEWDRMLERLREVVMNPALEEGEAPRCDRDGIVIVTEGGEGGGVMGECYVAMDDVDNRDLRCWMAVQRYQKARRLRGMPSPMTSDRMARLEEIGFEWTPRRGARRKPGSGPSVEDWTKLFEEMRDRGIDKMPAKEHWFAGLGRDGFEDEDVTDGWEDEDLADLWNMEGSDDDDD